MIQMSGLPACLSQSIFELAAILEKEDDGQYLDSGTEKLAQSDEV